MRPTYNQSSTEASAPIESLPSLLIETEKEWNIYEEGLTESRGSPRESEIEGELPRMLEEGENEEIAEDVSSAISAHQGLDYEFLQCRCFVFVFSPSL